MTDIKVDGTLFKEERNACVPARFSHVPLFCDPMNCSLPGYSSIGFSRQEYLSGLPCPPPGDLPNSGIRPTFPAPLASQTDSLPTEPPGKPEKNNTK